MNQANNLPVSGGGGISLAIIARLGPLLRPGRHRHLIALRGDACAEECAKNDRGRDEALSNHLYDSRSAAFRIAADLMRDGLAGVLVGDAPLHHELHMFELGDISERIAVNGDEIGIPALLHGADVSCVAYEICR